MSLTGRWWRPDFPFDPAKMPFYYGWVIVTCTAVGIISSIPGQTVGVNVLNDTFMAQLDLSRFQLALAYLVGTGCSSLFLPAGGRYFDRWGARRFFVFSSFCFGLAILFMSQIDRVAHLATEFAPAGWVTNAAVASVGFLGIRFWGQGMVTLGARSMMAQWWVRKRGLVVAINGTIVGAGFAIAPRVFYFFVEQIGWRDFYYLLAAVMCLLLTAFGWLLFHHLRS